ncbi:MAG: tyrosine-type recombinase/integrase [Spirochaetes bacterium]|nr:tyrosine-type recombinase/integrase [Spirochaetota bacterium]
MESQANQSLPGAAATWSYLATRLTGEEMTLLRGFLTDLQSDLTRQTYLYSTKRFMASHSGSLLAVTGEALRGWASAALTSMNRLTVKATLIALRAFFNHACRVQSNLRHPFDGLRLRLPTVRDAEAVGMASKVLTPGQIRTVCERLDAEETRLGKEFPGGFLWRFLAGTGLRVSEALSLNFYDPAREGEANYVNYVRVLHDGRCLVRVLGKARRVRDVLLGEELSEAFTRKFPSGTIDAGAPVFITHDIRRTRLSRHGAHWEAKRVAEKFMYDFPGGMSKRFHLHMLRHALCTTLLCDQGADPIHVARLMGHSPQMLARVYLHGTRDLLKGLRLAS